MANIKKIIRKDGVSYKITVSMGRTREGKQQRHYKTFKSPQGISENKADKLAVKKRCNLKKNSTWVISRITKLLSPSMRNTL